MSTKHNKVMKTIVKTKVYEIRQSSKGWSGIYAMYFDKDKALEHAEELKELAKQNGLKTNYKVYEHTTMDCIIYTEE